MIIKVNEQGHDPAGLVAYLGGPGTLDEHIDPHIVGASITPSGPLDKELRDQAVADLRMNAKIWPDVKIYGGHIWHSTIAIGKKEGQLPDRVWEGISRDYIKGMEFGDVNWISVNHGPSSKGNDHVHVVASLVRDDGTKAEFWDDRYQSKQLAAQLEDKYELEPLPGRRMGTAMRSSGQKDLARARDQGLPESRRSQIERTVRASASVVSNLDDFKDILDANGLKFHPYPETGGPTTGYSVSLEATRRKDGDLHRWAGGKLARDLSLPRLQMVWKSNASTKPTHIRAVQELQDLQRKLPTADALALEDASHQLAGALAAASLATEDPPGDLADASRQAGSYAQTVRAQSRSKPPALSVGALFLFAADPTGPVGKSVMIMQLMAAFRALMDAQFARRGLVTTRERIPSMAGQAGPEEEMLELGVTTGLTTGALLVEHRARAKEAAALATSNDPKKDLWDAKKIRQMRKDAEAAEAAKTAALRPPPGAVMITPDQMVQVQKLADHFDMPDMLGAAAVLTEREAALYIARLNVSAVPLVPNVGRTERPITTLTDAIAFEDGLIAKHGDKVPSVHVSQPNGHPYGKPGDLLPIAAPAADLRNPATWKTGDVPATELQVLWLTRTGGLSEDEARKMTKAGASSYRNSVEKTQGLTPKPKVHKPPPGRGPGLGK